MENQNSIDFIGIGAPKSASTWVAVCLEEHPGVSFSRQKEGSTKELRFFNTGGSEAYYGICSVSHFEEGRDWYLSKFPAAQSGKVRGEFGVCYLIDERAPQRIKDKFPDAKILVCLRNPVDMIYSLYWECRKGVKTKVPKNFNKAVENGFYDEVCAADGLYYRQLKRYFDIFSEENVHTIVFDDVRSSSRETVKALYQFLGVDSNFEPSILDKKVRPSMQTRFMLLNKLAHYFLRLFEKIGSKKMVWEIFSGGPLYSLYSKINLVTVNYPSMDPAVREKLKEYYKDDIEKLEDLIKRDLSAWK